MAQVLYSGLRPGFAGLCSRQRDRALWLSLLVGVGRELSEVPVQIVRRKKARRAVRPVKPHGPKILFWNPVLSYHYDQGGSLAPKALPSRVAGGEACYRPAAFLLASWDRKEAARDRKTRNS